MSRVAVGIDVGEPRKGLDLVALDEQRAVVATQVGATVDEVARLVLEELRPSVVCVDSPSQWASLGKRRDAERALTKRGINLFTTPAEARASAFHGWMRNGFEVYNAIAPAYPRYRGGAVERTAAEYYPHMSAVALTGHIGDRRDKRAFRTAALERHSVTVGGLRGQDQIDAALGALTGLIALEGGHSWVGADDDTILVPVTDLPDRYVRIRSAAQVPFELTARARASRPRVMRACACGCGAEGPGSFRSGHDAKLRSQLLRRIARGDFAAEAELARRGWH